MNTRLTCTDDGQWRPWLIAVASACMLSACASFVPVGAPQTPEQLLSLVKRLADSGRLNDPESVASILGSTATLRFQNTIRAAPCELGITQYDVPRDYLPWDRSALRPIVSLGRTLDPELFRPQITDFWISSQTCPGEPARIEAHLEIKNLLYWFYISQSAVTRYVGKPLRHITDDLNVSFAYRPPNRDDSRADFLFARKLDRIIIEQGPTVIERVQ